MANTKTQYAGDGATQNFSVPFPYIDKTHVKVYIDGTLMFDPSDYQFTTSSNIQTTVAPVVDSLVEIIRETPIDTKFVNFQNGAILTEQEMDLDSEQAFYLLQENQENYKDLIDDALIALATENGLIVTDPALVLDQLIQTMIDSTAAATLSARITDIDDNAEAILSNANAIVNENLGRITDYNDLQSQINALVSATVATVYVQPEPPVPGVSGIPDPIPTGARWYDSNDSNHPYLWDDVGLVWQDLEDPRIGANAASITALDVRLTTAEGDIVTNASAVSVLDTTVTNINGVVSANASDITQLQVDLAATDATVLAQGNAASALTTRVSDAEGAIGVNSTAITALDGAIIANDGDIAANAAAVSALDTRVTSAEGSITSQSSDITLLFAEVDTRSRTFRQATAPTAENTGDLWFDTDDDKLYRWTGTVWEPIQDFAIQGNASAISGLDARVTVTEGDISSNAFDITALDSRITTAEGSVITNASAITGLDTRVSSAEGTITSQGSAITTLQSDVDLRSTVFRQATAPTANNTGDLWFDSDDGDKLYRWTGTIWQDVQDAAIAANASATSALDTRVTAAEGTIISEASLVDTLQSQMTTAQGDISSAEVTIAAHTSAISTAESDIVALEARYGVSLNVNGYVSGFSLNNSGTVSDFVIMADKFAIVDPTGDPGETEFIPFSVSGGVVSMQNVAISGNLVVNGTLAAGAFQTLTGGLADIDTNMGAITTGTITLDSTSHIKGGQTAYATGTGFFLGYSGAAYKFSIGNATNFLTWDGTTLEVVGDVKVGQYIVDATETIAEANTERSKTGTTIVEVKKFTMDREGEVRVSYDRRHTGASYANGITRIKVNGAIKYTLSEGSIGWTNTFYDLVGANSLSVGDEITIEYGSGQFFTDAPEPGTVYVRNAQLRAVITIPGNATVNTN